MSNEKVVDEVLSIQNIPIEGSDQKRMKGKKFFDMVDFISSEVGNLDELRIEAELEIDDNGVSTGNVALNFVSYREETEEEKKNRQQKEKHIEEVLTEALDGSKFNQKDLYKYLKEKMS